MSTTNLYPFCISEIVSNHVKVKRKTINSMNDLSQIICNSTWSHSTFAKRYRNKENFLQTNLIVLDVDSCCTIEDAKRLFKSYTHIIGTTRSHQKNKNGLICNRFRIVLFLDRPITSSDDFKATWETLQEKYPFIDNKCSSPSWQWFPCISVESVNKTGTLIPVILYKPVQVPNREEEGTILDSIRTNGFGMDYYKPIYRYLYNNVRWKKLSVANVARYVASRVTGLKTGRERINQVWLAKHLKVTQATASRLIKKLIELNIIAVQQYATTGVDSTVYKAGDKLRQILKVRSTAEPTDVWRNGTAHGQMLRHIQWCCQNGKSKADTLKFCLKMQGQRPADKMRTSNEIKAVIDNWWSKASKRAKAS